MKSSNTAYVSRLDHLRFVAATLVVLYHVIRVHVTKWDVSNPALALITEGHTGVALFMVMSGYIFATIARDHSVEYVPFLRNRVLRIYPLYVFALLLAAYDAGADLLKVLAALLPFNNLGVPLNAKFGHLWTIAVELQFYLLFPLLWSRFRQGGRRQLMALLGLLLMSRLIMYGANGAVFDLSYWTIFGRLDQFLIGMLLALAPKEWLGRLRHPAWLLASVAALVAGATWMEHAGAIYPDAADRWYWVVLPTLEGLVWGAVVVTYLACAVTIPARIDRALAWLGRISYSIYVMHLIIIIALSESIGTIDFGGDEAVNALIQGVLIALPVTIAVAAITYNVIELPFLQHRVRYLKEPDAEPPAADDPPASTTATAPARLAAPPVMWPAPHRPS